VGGGLALAGLGLLSGCGLLPAGPEQRGVARVGYLAIATGARGSSSLGLAGQQRLDALRAGLLELGYVEGQNLVLETRLGMMGQAGALEALAAELVSSQVDLIVAAGGAAAVAARDAAAGLPVVFTEVGAPIEVGLAQSLAQPGGSATGLASLSSVVGLKRLELLKATAPALSRPAVVWDPADPNQALELAALQRAAPDLGLQVRAAEAPTQAMLVPALEAAVGNGANGVIVIPENVGTGVVANFALRARLPSIATVPSFAAGGGLLAFGADLVDLYRRAATYVAKILKGARPADLPIEQPAKFDFVVNQSTAAALGLSVPESVLLQATWIIP
jgi:putative ABC transport system substrate-binding protein